MSRVYRSPRSRSAAAAITPARLAQEFGQTLWRERPDGELEVATMRDGRVQLFLVQDDGSTTSIATEDPVFGHRWASPLAFSGWGLCLVSIIAMGVWGEGAAWGLAGWLIGFAAFVAGGIVSERADDLEKQLEKRPGKGEWHEPTNLNGWVPRTSEQLATVERIADEHEGLARVKDVGARTVEVCAIRRGEVEHYWVDELGRADIAQRGTLRQRYVADRLLHALCIALWIGLLAVGFGVQHNKGLLLAVLLGSLVAVYGVGWLNGRRLSLERVVGRDQSWIEIRTQVEESDD